MNKDFEISRRSVLKLSAAAGLVFAAPFAGSAFAAEPKRGGHLVMASQGASTSDGLDPRTFNSPFLYVMSGVLYNTLVEVTGVNADLTPGLAKSWSSPDGKVWTFELVDNATFHDGKPFTADDAVFSILSHKADDSRSNLKGQVTNFVSVKADGPHKLIVELPEANFVFPAFAASFNLCMVPAGTTTYSGVGTGPYKVTRFAPGEVLEAARNDTYFKKNAAWVDSVELLAINDPAALNSAFQAGQIQMASQLDARTLPLLQSNPSIKLFQGQTRGFICFNMKVDAAPFDNNDLRMALKYAVDREDMIKRTMAGLARVGNDTPIAPNDPTFAPGVAQTPHDPAKAKELFEKSGYKGPPLVLQTSDAISSRAVDMATVFQEHCTKAGIPVEVKREPADGYWENIVGKTPFHVSARTDRPTADAIFSVALLSTSSNNEVAWKNADFDAAVIGARAEADATKRNELYAKAQAICSTEGPLIVPYFANTLEGTAASLDGYQASTAQLSGYRAVEQVWFA
ncbi:MAG: ABC transporter substrate-binding protein [Rhizobiaceae bacterium]